MKIVFALLFLTLTSCASKKYSRTVPFVDRDRMMIDWYVQAGRFTFLEKEVHNGIERYRWNEKKKQVDIHFTYNKRSLDGPLKEYRPKAWLLDDSNTRWLFQLIWPFRSELLILDVGPDYEWMAMGITNQRYLWVMSRSPQFSREKVELILGRLKEQGYDTSDIVFVPHNP